MKKKIDWSENKWKEALIDPRKHLWSESQIESISKWAGFEEKSSVLDVGCGLGYLGWTYAPYFPKGSYTGIDVSENLVKEAMENSGIWKEKIDTRFAVGNCNKLDFDNNTFDIVMCQTLLMHLKEPQKAVNEMVRVLKKGGTLLCFEPDNISSSMKISFNNIKEIPLDLQLQGKKIALLHALGRKLLGRETGELEINYLCFFMKQVYRISI